MPKLTLALVDDHEVVREGLRALLEAQPDFMVVGEAGTGSEAPDLVDRLRPDVLLLDLLLPDLNGLEVLRVIEQRTPATRILVLSMCASDNSVLEALRSGAAGYCFKTASSRELIDGVRAVAAGKRYLSPSLSDRVIEAYVRQARVTPDAYSTLTNREREVLYLAAEGQTNADIAAKLGISPRTVESHRANLMRKLGLESQTDLIRFGIRHALIPAE